MSHLGQLRVLRVKATVIQPANGEGNAHSRSLPEKREETKATLEQIEELCIKEK